MKRIKLILLSFMALSVVGELIETPSLQAADWPMFGGDAKNSLHQADESTITPNNVSKLFSKWSTKLPGSLFKIPVVDSSGVYVMTSSHVLRLDKTSGAIRWEKSIDQLARECPAIPGEELPPSPIALSSETSPAIAGDRLVITTLPNLETFTDLNVSGKGGGFVLITDKEGNCQKRILVTENPFEGILGSPSIHNGVAYVGISSYEEQAASIPGYQCCTTRGKVCAVDIAAGTKKWCTSLIDADPSTPEYDAVKGEVDVRGISGVTVWSSSPTIDEKNNQVIVTTGNAYTISTEVDPRTLPAKSLPVDAFVAIDLDTGVIKNVHRVVADDFWNVDCLDQSAGNCMFEPVGPDYDFGAGANLLTFNGVDIAVAINKAANIYAVETATLTPFWQTNVGPTNLLGLAGSTTDGSSIYASNPVTFDIDFERLPESPIVPREWTLRNCPHPDPHMGCPKTYGGALSAIDPGAGGILWQNTDPSNLIPLPDVQLDEFTNIKDFGKTPYLAPPSSANGIVFQGGVYPNFLLIEDGIGNEELTSLVFGEFPNANAAECPFPDYLSGICTATFPSMFAFDGVSGDILWTFNASGPVIAGAAIADGVVYWGSFDIAEEDSSTLYAFTVPPEDSGIGGGPPATGPGPSPALGGGGCSLQREGR